MRFLRRKKIYYLFILPILFLSLLFISCDSQQTQLKATDPETTVSILLKSSLIETTTLSETTIKETETALETTPNTTESVKETTVIKPTETTQTVTKDTTTVIIKGTLKVHFIDVGQGDSILIQTPEGNTMLIDGGPQASASRLVSYIKNLGITKLNVVVATHPHEEHIG